MEERKKSIRLDKYLADMKVGTRSQVKSMIRKGLVTLNGNPVKASEIKVTPQDQVAVNGIVVSYAEYEYWMLNKPAGVVSATRDPREQTVLDLLKDAKRRDLSVTGRLDKDTEGLLLLTNDGDLIHRLLAPGKHVDKVYQAIVEGVVTQTEILRFAEGLDIGDEKQTLPAKLQILTSGSQSEILLTIQEGRFHQVKRMFESVGMKVLWLKRLSMGPLYLDETLKPGESRPLTAEELKMLNCRGGSL